MTPEERRQLVEAPLPVIHICGHSYGWCGTSVTDDEHKTRLHSPHPRESRQGILGLHTIDTDNF